MEWENGMDKNTYNYGHLTIITEIGIRMKYLTLLLIGVSFMLSSCSSEPTCGENSDEFLLNYFALVREVQMAKLSVSDAGWNKFDEQFKSYVEECYQLHQEEMTRGQRRSFWAKAMQYYYYRYGSGMMNELKNDSNALSRRIKREIDSRWDRPGSALDEAMMKAARDWQKVKENRSQKEK